MRRKEFDQSHDQAELEAFLQEMSFGFLASVRPDGTPGITPLNFVYRNGSLYFHGSRAGEKIKSLKANEQVSFCVAREYALIPSYFEDPELACPATAYFKSVLLRGTASLVENLEEKADALQAMMAKLQPEGGHEPIRADDARYRGNLKGVAVIRLNVEHISAKFKFGQNLTEPKREAVAGQLERRGCPFDHETAALMRRYAPDGDGQPQPAE
ncbi:putative pyridoxamine 5 '-phosphate-related protein [Paenibacillus pasadenensis]|uniref:Putative pyridoxamine 5 '-phosphate-related protein n=1 Tax=Paenibacillus pasadenensis TaxID=217090 RepID=A0A2N5N445_9BACL|nr:pyridoxamine 5'-phosphate oxidase family protein [Paenibacillus pasadenensis]PLT45125.1 putative pyridoxamine 5 '-phosphate-related protein [Paenibacillus pasadenensis]